MKKLLIFMLCALMIAASGCGSSKPVTDTSVVDSQTAESSKQEAASALVSSYSSFEGVIEGYCIKGTDGMLVLIGEGENQAVCLIIGEEDGCNILDTLKDGDQVKLNCDIIEDYYPTNLIIKSGEVVSSGNVPVMNQDLYSTLTGVYMLDSDIAEKGIINVQ